MGRLAAIEEAVETHPERVVAFDELGPLPAVACTPTSGGATPTVVIRRCPQLARGAAQDPLRPCSQEGGLRCLKSARKLLDEALAELYRDPPPLVVDAH